MAISTVTQAQHRASDTQVNKRSGLWQTLRGKRTDGDEPFAPNEQSCWVLDQFKTDLRGELTKVVSALTQPKRTVASPTDLDGSRPAYLLRRLAMLALDLEIDPNVTFEDAVKRLQWAWDMLNQRAAEQAAFERHTPVNAAEAAAHGALLGAAARRGKPIGPRSERGQVAVAEIVDRAVRAPEPTGLQMALTPDVLARLDAERVAQTAVLPVVETVTVAQPASAVQVPGSRPPVPDEGEETAGTGAHQPLPRRTAHPQITVLPVTVDEDGETADPMHAVTPARAPLEAGVWLLDEGAGSTGPVWLLLARQRGVIRDQGPGAVLEFANGHKREVGGGEQVKVLAEDRARELLAVVESRRAEAVDR